MKLFNVYVTEPSRSGMAGRCIGTVETRNERAVLRAIAKLPLDAGTKLFCRDAALDPMAEAPETLVMNDDEYVVIVTAGPPYRWEIRQGDTIVKQSTESYRHEGDAKRAGIFEKARMMREREQEPRDS